MILDSFMKGVDLYDSGFELGTTFLKGCDVASKQSALFTHVTGTSTYLKATLSVFLATISSNTQSAS